MKEKMNFRLQLLIAIVSIFGLTNTFAQTNEAYKLTASVMDLNEQDIGIGNVLLLSPDDSSMVTGDVFYDGSIDIEVKASGKFLLQVSALGYTEKTIEVEVKSAYTHLGKLTLSENTLSTVKILSRRELFQQKGNVFVLNVENSPLRNLGNASDVLRNAPKITFNSANQIQVVGRGAAVVYVDGKLIASNQVLSFLNASDIKEIEIIENPSAKYDAAGNAVINIKTRKTEINGYGVNIVNQVGHGEHLRGLNKINAHMRYNKVLFQAGFTNRPVKFDGQNDYRRKFSIGESNLDIDNVYRYTITQTRNNYNAKCQYELSADYSIGVDYSGGFSTSKRKGLNRNDFHKNELKVFDLDTRITGPFDQSNNNISLYSNLVLDSMGSAIKGSIQYGDYDLERIEYIDPTYVASGVTEDRNSKRTFNTNDIKLYSGQLDINQVLSDKLSIEAGGKVAMVDNISSLNFSNELAAGNYLTVDELSTDYTYEESIQSLYFQANLNHMKWGFQAGLRSEWTQSSGESRVANDINHEVKNNYHRLFPNITISRKLNENNRISVSYTERIVRPTFQDLNPFVFYVDSLVAFHGNPRLQPEFSKHVSLNLQQNKWQFNLGYTKVGDKINTILELRDAQPSARFNFLRQNTISTEEYALTVTRPFQKGKYSSYYSVTARYEDHRYLDQEKEVSNSKPGLYFYTSQSIILPEKINMSLIYQYTSSRVDGLYTDRPISSLSINLSRSFMNDKLKVSLHANDIFDQYRFKGKASIFGNDWTYLSAGDWRYVNLSLNWNLGKNTSRGFKNGNQSKDELNRISKQ